jgi:hypothetical protein
LKHPSIKQLFGYWNLRRGRRMVPERGDIDPSAIRSVLADTFILSFEERNGHPFRVAGTRVCAMFGRELKNEAYLGLWDLESRTLARDLLGIVADECIGVVASAAAAGSDGTRRGLELLLLPLRHGGATDSRVLGALAPTDGAAWLGAVTLGRLTMETIRYVGSSPTTPAKPRMALPPGRIRHGFVVYDGGQG